MSLKSLLQGNQFFLTFTFLLLFIGAYPPIAFDKIALHLLLNSWHHPLLDYFFYYVTPLGHGVAYILLLATLLVGGSNNKTLLIGASSFVAMSAVVQGMKRLLFFDQLRPVALISTDTFLHLVEGVTPQTHLSFPSGHAGTIFTAICVMHFVAPKKPAWLSLLLLFIAIAVAYSRVYLCQHFYIDVYIGAIIGISSTTIVYALLQYWRGPDWLYQSPRALWDMFVGKR